MNGAHLHLLINHVPVLGTLLALAVLLAALSRGGAPWARGAFRLLVALGVVTLGVFLTGEPAEESVEDLPGVAESLIESHEEAARAATIALGVLGAFALGALAWFRRRPLPRWTVLAATAGTLAAAGLIGWTANLGGQIRHSEIRSGAVRTATDERADGNDTRRDGRVDNEREDP